jgi:hypothetical protein
MMLSRTKRLLLSKLGLEPKILEFQLYIFFTYSLHILVQARYDESPAAPARPTVRERSTAAAHAYTAILLANTFGKYCIICNKNSWKKSNQHYKHNIIFEFCKEIISRAFVTDSTVHPYTYVI